MKYHHHSKNNSLPDLKSFSENLIAIVPDSNLNTVTRALEPKNIKMQKLLSTKSAKKKQDFGAVKILPKQEESTVINKDLNENDMEDIKSRVANYNQQFEGNLKKYRDKKEENDEFLRNYNLLKKMSDENASKKKGRSYGPELVFRDLIFSYKEKGYKIPDFSTEKNLFKPSGLLLEENKLISYFKTKGSGKPKVENCKEIFFLQNLSLYMNEISSAANELKAESSERKSLRRAGEVRVGQTKANQKDFDDSEIINTEQIIKDIKKLEKENKYLRDKYKLAKNREGVNTNSYHYNSVSYIPAHNSQIPQLSSFTHVDSTTSIKDPNVNKDTTNSNYTPRKTFKKDRIPTISSKNSMLERKRDSRSQLNNASLQVSFAKESPIKSRIFNKEMNFKESFYKDKHLGNENLSDEISQMSNHNHIYSENIARTSSKKIFNFPVQQLQQSQQVPNVNFSENINKNIINSQTSNTSQNENPIKRYSSPIKNTLVQNPKKDFSRRSNGNNSNGATLISTGLNTRVESANNSSMINPEKEKERITESILEAVEQKEQILSQLSSDRKSRDSKEKDNVRLRHAESCKIDFKKTKYFPKNTKYVDTISDRANNYNRLKSESPLKLNKFDYALNLQNPQPLQSLQQKINLEALYEKSLKRENRIMLNSTNYGQGPTIYDDIEKYFRENSKSEYLNNLDKILPKHLMNNITDLKKKVSRKDVMSSYHGLSDKVANVEIDSNQLKKIKELDLTIFNMEKYFIKSLSLQEGR